MTDTPTTQDIPTEPLKALHFWREPARSAELSPPADWSDAVALIKAQEADLLWCDSGGNWHAFRLRPEYGRHRKQTRTLTEEVYASIFGRSRS